jgi:hypothetical protein
LAAFGGQSRHSRALVGDSVPEVALPLRSAFTTGIGPEGKDLPMD